MMMTKPELPEPPVLVEEAITLQIFEQLAISSTGPFLNAKLMQSSDGFLIYGDRPIQENDNIQIVTYQGHMFAANPNELSKLIDNYKISSKATNQKAMAQYEKDLVAAKAKIVQWNKQEAQEEKLPKSMKSAWKYFKSQWM